MKSVVLLLSSFFLAPAFGDEQLPYNPKCDLVIIGGHGTVTEAANFEFIPEEERYTSPTIRNGDVRGLLNVVGRYAEFKMVFSSSPGEPLKTTIPLSAFRPIPSEPVVILEYEVKYFYKIAIRCTGL